MTAKIYHKVFHYPNQRNLEMPKLLNKQYFNEFMKRQKKGASRHPGHFTHHLVTSSRSAFITDYYCNSPKFSS